MNGAAVRVGFTASRKVGNAVVRNRAKRRLRAAAAEILARNGGPGMDYVLIARTGTRERRYEDLLTDLASALRQVAGQPYRKGSYGLGSRKSRPSGEKRGGEFQPRPAEEKRDDA